MATTTANVNTGTQADNTTASNTQTNNGNNNTQGTQTNNANNNANQNTQTENFLSSLLGLGNSTPQANFVKGALIGAAAAYIISNPEAQKAIFKGIAKITSLFEMGVEELKERYEDAKAEAKDS